MAKGRGAVGDRIAEMDNLLRVLRWTKAEAARRMNVSPVTVRNWSHEGPPGAALAYLRVMATVKATWEHR